MNRAPQSLRTYFLTFVCADRWRVFRETHAAELMLETLQHYRAQKKFELHSFVVMPDHIHLLVTPAENVALERVVQLIKGGYSFRLKYKGDVWERGHFGKRVPDRDAYEACVTYIEQNPVKARFVGSAEEFSYSSALRKDMVDSRPGWLM